MNFDATRRQTGHRPNEPLPIGWYKMAIVASEMKPTNDRRAGI
jgi:hypothetical protein